MFTNKQKVTALTICHLFETSKPLGDADEVAVLPDGAGISYGIPQATDKSGNLDDVLERYIVKQTTNGDEPLYAPFFKTLLVQLRKKSQSLINSRAKNSEIKRILKEAGATDEMREAQEENIDSRMRSAIRKAIGSGFKTTMALAVIYDSLNHGSYDLIRDRNSTKREDYKTDLEFEQAWITEYVNDRDRWLENHSKVILRSTDYRTDFFLAEIKVGNWSLKTPINVHGFKLTEKQIELSLDSMIKAKAVKSIVSENLSKERDHEFTEGERPKEQIEVVVDGATQPTEEAKVGQTIIAEAKDEATGESISVKTETEFEQPTKTEYLEREKPSFTTKVYAAIAFLGGVWATFKATVLDPVGETPTVKLVIIGLIAIGLSYIGYMIWDKSSDRAQERNIAKANFASNIKTNTVEFTK